MIGELRVWTFARAPFSAWFTRQHFVLHLSMPERVSGEECWQLFLVLELRARFRCMDSRAPPARIALCLGVDTALRGPRLG